MARKKTGPEHVDPILHYGCNWCWWGRVHKPGGAWWAAAWTTEKVIVGKHRGKYIAVLFKWDKAAKYWKVVRTAGRAARWRVKDLAYRWHCDKSGDTFTSQHRKRAVDPTRKFQWLVRRAADRARGAECAPKS